MNTADWLRLTAGAVTAGGLLAAVYAWRRTGPVSAGPTGAMTPSPQQLTAAELPVLASAQLLDALGVRGDVAAIRDSLGLSQVSFDRDALPVIERVAEFVQQLPASECHHHANPGGLLQHVLDVARRSLAIRSGMELPRGCSPEDRASRKHRWSFGVFLAAILHDIGKPAADVVVTYRRAGEHESLPWQPLAGTMLDVAATGYRVQFKSADQRDYGAHERLGVVLMQRCVPAATLAWLSEDGELMRCLYAILSGDKDHAGALAEIVTRADRESTAFNLAHGSRARFASATSVPLIEVLMSALRHLLSNHDGVSVPLNASGGAGFIDDEHVWLVVPRVVDLVLDEVKRREPGRALPSDRTRIFDTFKEYGAIVARPDGRTVWKVIVRGDAPHFSTAFRHELSAIKFRRDLLYRSGTDTENFRGVIDVVSDGALPSAPDLTIPSATVTTGRPELILTPSPPDPVTVVNPPGGDGVEAALSTDSPAAPDVAPSSPAISLAPGIAPPSSPSVSTTSASAMPGGATKVSVPPPSRPGRLPSPGSAAVMAPLASPQTRPAPPTTGNTGGGGALAALDALLGLAPSSAPPADHDAPGPLVPGETVTSAGAPTTADPDLALVAAAPPSTPEVGIEVLAPVAVPHPTRLPSSEGATMGSLASGFIRWLQEGLASRAIECNGANAFVHTVPEGLGLVSPRTFQVFAASLSGEIQPGNRLPKELSPTVVTTVSKLQSELKKAKLVQKNDQKANTDYFHAYLSTASNKRINMMLLQEPARFFSSLPTPNRALERAPVQTLEVK